MNVAVIGCGYVGLSVVVEAVRAGFDVAGVEIHEGKLALLEQGMSPTDDVDVTNEELSQLLATGRLRFEAKLDAPADVIVICVPTPLRDGQPDVSFIESAGVMASAQLRNGAVVVLESTTYPGTTEDLLRPILEEGSGLQAGRDFHLAHSPERIDPGNPAFRLRNTPKIVGGLTAECTRAAVAFYSQLVDDVVAVSSPRAAEMAKLLENSFRHVNIALANEMSIVCHDLGIDPWEVIDAAATKPFGYVPFRPGPGVGGHCLLPGERVIVRTDDGTDVAAIEEVWAAAAASDRPMDVAGVEVVLPHGLSVASLDGDAGSWDAVAALGRRRYDGDAIRLTARDGRSIAVTSDHPMLVHRDGGLVACAARDVREGDLVPIWRGHECWDALLNPRLDVLDHLTGDAPSIGVRICGDDSKRRIALDEFRARHAQVPHEDVELWTGRGPGARSFPAVVELTPDVARLVGYYLAQGCVVEGGATLKTVFTFHRDETEAITDVRKLLGSLGVAASIYNDPHWRTTQIMVSSRLFGTLIRDVLGCGAGSYDARVPPVLLGASAAHRRELLSGLLRGDGSVWTESGAHRITDAIEFLMLSVGDVPEIERGHGEAFALRPSGSASGGLHLVPIADVERFQHLGDVYSLETRPSHTFAATHGIVVHNCIPVDPQYLAWRVRGAMGHQFRMLEVAQDINERMPAYVSQRCAEVLNEHGKAVRGAKVLLLGMAYKGGAADTRESPALRVAARLQRMGAEIAYHDPFVSRVEVDGIERDSVSLSKDLVHLFDIVVILTDHPDVDYDAIVRDARIVYDTRNATAGLDGPNVHRA